MEKIRADSEKQANLHASKMELSAHRNQLSVASHEAKTTIASNAKLQSKKEMNNVNAQKYTLYSANYGLGSGGMQGKDFLYE